MIRTIEHVGFSVTQDGPDQNPTAGRVLLFRPRRGAGRPAAPRVVPRAAHDLDGAPIDDLAKYEQVDDRDDYAHRMRMNAAAVILVTILVGAGVWIANTMAEMQKAQDCVLQGRRNCAPIDVQSLLNKR
jgi:hypothetical protein